MAKNVKYSLEATNENIVVGLLKTKCMVSYRKGASGLLLFHVRGDEAAPIREAEFQAHAWQLATEKARALGWIE
jgi:hypothetical protein